MADDAISLNEAARLSGVSPSTLKRWAEAKVIPVKDGRWTSAAAAQARVVARMRERGHSLDELRRAVRDGRLAFGYVEDLFPGTASARSRGPRRRRAPGLEEELIERVMTLLGTPTALEGTLNEQDVRAIARHGRGARRRLPARRPAAARPRLRAVDPQDRRGRGPALPPLRARAADPPGRRRARDGRGDGGARARPAAADLAADGVHPPALPALLHRAGRRRPHGGRLRRPAADGPGADGVLLRRPHRLHPLHRGGGRRGGARPGRALRRDGRGDAAVRGADREDDRRRGDDRLARPGDR